MNKSEYDRMFNVEDSHWWYVGLHELIMATVAAEKKAFPLAIFDAGCGTGRLCQLLQPVGKVEGCDLSQRALDLSRSRGLKDLFHADLNKVDLGENRYDVITSIDVLSQLEIEDEARIIAGFYRALKPGGILILNIVAFEFLRSTHDIAVHTRIRYTDKELLPVLRQAGFRIEKATYRLGFLFVPIAIYRLAKRIFTDHSQAEHVYSDVDLPPQPVNSLLLQIVRLENRFLRRRNLPFGTSLYITARKGSV